jgi:hypothetical protein
MIMGGYRANREANTHSPLPLGAQAGWERETGHLHL